MTHLACTILSKVLLQRIVILATLLSIISLSLAGPPVHAGGHGDAADEESWQPGGDLNPAFVDDYFEDNPEEGDSPWGSATDACHDEFGCIFDLIADEGDENPPSAPPGIPGDPCVPVEPIEPAPDAAQAAAALGASLGVNPHERGLTGLDTWLWVDEAPAEVSWSQTGSSGVDEDCDAVPAPDVTFTATVDSWTFDVDGEHEQATYTSDAPGTEDDPAATHVFDYVDVYHIELTANLRGDVDTSVTVDGRDYEVVEVRSRLTR